MQPDPLLNSVVGTHAFNQSQPSAIQAGLWLQPQNSQKPDTQRSMLAPAELQDRRTVKQDLQVRKVWSSKLSNVSHLASYTCTLYRHVWQSGKGTVSSSCTKHIADIAAVQLSNVQLATAHQSAARQVANCKAARMSARKQPGNTI